MIVVGVATMGLIERSANGIFDTGGDVYLWCPDYTLGREVGSSVVWTRTRSGEAGSGCRSLASLWGLGCDFDSRGSVEQIRQCRTGESIDVLARQSALMAEASAYISAIARTQAAEKMAAQRATYVEQQSYVEFTSGGAEQWRSLICNDPFTWDCGWALATIQCESSGDPTSVGVEGELRFIGLFQVWNGSNDPYQNAVEAHIKYVSWQRGEVGRPWPNCP